MYLKKSYDKRKNRTYLSIIHGYRDENGKTETLRHGNVRIHESE